MEKLKVETIKKAVSDEISKMEKQKPKAIHGL